MSDLSDGASTPTATTPDKRIASEGDGAGLPAANNPQAAAKAARRRKERMVSIIAAVLLLIAFTAVWMRKPEHRALDSLSGYMTGISMAVFAGWIIGWWVRRRGGSSYSRALDGTQDERDELIWKSAWAFTGRVDWFLFLAALALAVLDVELMLGTVAIIGIWINFVALYGSRFYYERAM
ncbi:MAG: hypothetical protein E7Z94_08985 [Actinomyces ruminicola]|uniref:Uncharacterized protein n=1 Tax=Actinomyces ruminicola TaxID=332524 RepID=A0A1G9Z7D2_9ACTO|nr:hypothetical protein [Actinomyces ruminicola]MBE6482484.1 hypothetical protein [Actinomyces ruminicola]SDN17047.1 hypothetical protein SAMN04487766_11626 [Actinomyces ruminicola]